jgi:hypothetical protein
MAQQRQPSKTMVWAPKPLQELNFVTGFVQCEATLAASLLKAGKVQDPRRGALAMQPIAKPADRAMQPKAKAGTPAPAHPVADAPAPSPKDYDTRELRAKKHSASDEA